MGIRDTEARAVAVVAIIAAAMLWGTTGTVQALLPEGRDPLAVGALRLAIGAAGLLAIAVADPAARRALPRLPRGPILGAGLGMAAYNLAFFVAVSRAGIGTGTAITIGSAPIWATLLEAAAGRRPSPLRLAAQALAVAGIGILATGGTGAADPAGIAAALLSGLSYAGYSLLTARIATGAAPPVAVAGATFGAAALLALPVLAFADLAWIASPAAGAGLAVLGLGATTLSYILYTAGLRHLAASTAVTLALAEPVAAWLLATLLIEEPVTMRSGLGVVLILAGLTLISRAPPDRMR